MSSARRRRTRASCAALLALGVLAGPATPALAESEPADPRPLTAELVVAPQDPVIGEGADAAFDVLIRNTGEAAIPSGTIEVRIAMQAAQSPEELSAEPAAPTVHLAESRVGETAPESEQTSAVTVPLDELPALSARGVYAVRASFTPDTPDTSDTSGATTAPSVTAFTPVVWRGPAATGGGSDTAGAESPGTGSSLPLGVLVPFALPSEIRTLPTRSQLDELVPVWDRLLTAARAHRATLAIDPRVIAGIRAYGDDAPESSRQFLTRLEQSALPGFLLQFADADPAAQAALGYTSLLAPSSLDFVSRFGSFPPPPEGGNASPGADGAADTGTGGADDVRPEDAADASADDAGDAGDADDAGDAAQEDPGAEAEDPEAQTLPTLEELLDWPRGEAIAWPANGAVDTATLELLQASGIDTVVLGSGNATASDAVRTRISGSGVLITDDALGTDARAALAGNTAAERSAGAAWLTARLAFAAQEGAPGLLLGLDRGAAGESQDPAQLLELLSSFDWVEPVAASELPEGRAALRAGGTSEERLELLRSAANRESSVTELGAVLVHPEYLSGYQRARLLELFSTRYAAPDVDFDSVAAQFRERDAELLEGVRVISTEHTQLVGSSTRVPVQLRNALPFDAIVAVQVEPSSAALSVPERRFPDVVVPAEATERVLVPVRSRVSSGESGLVVTVSAAGGDPTVYTSTLPVSIRSSFETIALWTIGSLAALLLGFGTWRSVRRRRRLGAGGDRGAAEDADASVRGAPTDARSADAVGTAE
ncbi:DUF6049 family protein [Leucobacter triazinivorans]|uniref:Uncharacterized protein n=1 Tax=Leucobacter triazinivorans TaxID=1784719 RepID=A0A4P6KES8_9MICO|nr:DUF6049 family protein [Leucobacter triazinivorans]QBE48955.1 hypothetical protein EVS81_08995 [Leucobacter triazinivorans]